MAVGLVHMEETADLRISHTKNLCLSNHRAWNLYSSKLFVVVSMITVYFIVKALLLIDLTIYTTKA